MAEGTRRYQWIRTEMAVPNARFGQTSKAWGNFRQALQQPDANNYLWQRYGDFLLSQQLYKNLLWEMPEQNPDTGVQLRRLLAMRALGQERAALQTQLQSQLAQARLAEDLSQLTDGARFTLDVLDNATAALDLAQQLGAFAKPQN